MRSDSTLSEQQRAAAVGLFAAGYGAEAVATRLGAGRDAVGGLYDRWRVRGGDVLVTSAPRQVFPYDVKREVVQRFLAGEPKVALAREFGIASPATIQVWVRAYRADGDGGLRPKPKGRPRTAPGAPAGERSELERLRRENERRRAEVAYLEKLRALSARERR